MYCDIYYTSLQLGCWSWRELQTDVAGASLSYIRIQVYVFCALIKLQYLAQFPINQHYNGVVLKTQIHIQYINNLACMWDFVGILISKILCKIWAQLVTRERLYVCIWRWWTYLHKHSLGLLVPRAYPYNGGSTLVYETSFSRKNAHVRDPHAHTQNCRYAAAYYCPTCRRPLLLQTFLSWQNG